MCKNGRSLAWQLPESSTTKTWLAASVLIWIPTPMGASFSAAATQSDKNSKICPEILDVVGTAILPIWADLV